MGSSNSTTNTQGPDLWDLAREKATKIYNYRIKNYDYRIHGPYELYIIQVEAEYELECIPVQFRSGRGF
jgi:hypothetical protein